MAQNHADPDHQHWKAELKSGQQKVWKLIWFIWGTETCNFPNNKKRNSFFLLKMNAFDILGITKKT
jgi:hypothetical protein